MLTGSPTRQSAHWTALALMTISACSPSPSPVTSLRGDWTCTFGTDRSEPIRVDFPTAAFSPSRLSSERDCWRDIVVPDVEQPALSSAAAGKLPGGTLELRLGAEVLVPADRPYTGQLVHPLPEALRGQPALLTLTIRSLDGRLVSVGASAWWRIGPRPALERASLAVHVPDLALELVLLLFGALVLLGTPAVLRQDRSSGLLLGAFAGASLLHGLVRLHDNPLHPHLGLPYQFLGHARPALGLLIVWFLLDGFRRLSRSRANRLLQLIALPLLLGAALRAVVGFQPTVMALTNSLVWLVWPHLLICAAALLVRRQAVDVVGLAAIMVFLAGLATRLGVLSSVSDGVDLMALALYLTVGLLGVAVLLRVASRLAEISRLEGLARYVPSQLYQRARAGLTDISPKHVRRRVTIFFSDLVGFTALSEELEPEVLAEALGVYLTEMAAIAEAHGGLIDKFVGDAVMVWFGGLQQRDPADDARDCIDMALAMLAALPGVNERLRLLGVPRPVSARMGVHTGYATIGEFGSAQRADFTAVGRAVNLAARLESGGVPDAILISAATQVLVSDHVTCRPRGTIQPKGFHGPIETWLVTRDTPPAPVIALAPSVHAGASKEVD